MYNMVFKKKIRQLKYGRFKKTTCPLIVINMKLYIMTSLGFKIFLGSKVIEKAKKKKFYAKSE